MNSLTTNHVVDALLVNQQQQQISSTESSPAPPPPSGDGPAKRRRADGTTKGCCRTCRLRKVKCTGASPSGPCSNCLRLELACSFANLDSSTAATAATAAAATTSPDLRAARRTPSASHTEAGTLRKRAQRACGQCHAHKTKCSGDLPRCRRCQGGNLVCEYTPAKRKFTHLGFRHAAAAATDATDTNNNNSNSNSNNSIAPARSTPPVMPPLVSADELTSGPTTSSLRGYHAMLVDPNTLNAEDLMVKRDIISRHFDVYMSDLYWMPSLGFLHPATIRRQIQDMTLHPAKAAAICSVTCFYVHPGEIGRDFGQRCCNQVEAYLMRSLDKFSEESLMLNTLNTLFNLFLGSYARAWICNGVGSRVMVGLQANWDSDIYRNRSFVQQESLRRLVWQTFYIDRLLAGGYDEYLATRDDTWKLRLPCAEEAYRDNRPVTAGRLHDSTPRLVDKSNLHAWSLRICDLRHRIQATAKKWTLPQANISQPEPSRVMSEIRALQNELGRFHMSLPAELKLSDEVIGRIMGTEQRNGYVFLHSHIGMSHVDLYRFSLPGMQGTAPELLRRMPRDFVVKSQKQAVAHSISVATFCDAIRREHQKHPTTLPVRLTGDYSITHMCTLAMRVLVVALCHGLYRDIAGVTTSPPWRGINSRVVTAEDVRAMIDDLFEVMEPWSHISRITKLAYDANRAMVAHYYRTGRLIKETAPATLSVADELATRRGGGGGGGGTTGVSSIFGSGDEAAGQQWGASAAGVFGGGGIGGVRWSGTGGGGERLGSEEAKEEEEEGGGGGAAGYGPPGTPLFLEQARMSPLKDVGLELYDGDNSIGHASGPLWEMTEMTEAIMGGWSGR